MLTAFNLLLRASCFAKLFSYNALKQVEMINPVLKRMQNIFLSGKETQILSSYFHVVLSFTEGCVNPPSRLRHSTYKTDVFCSELWVIRTHLIEVLQQIRFATELNLLLFVFLGIYVFFLICSSLWIVPNWNDQSCLIIGWLEGCKPIARKLFWD